MTCTLYPNRKSKILVVEVFFGFGFINGYLVTHNVQKDLQRQIYCLTTSLTKFFILLFNCRVFAMGHIAIFRLVRGTVSAVHTIELGE